MLSNEDRLKVANLTGLAARYASGSGEGADVAPQVAVDLDNGGGPVLAMVVAELHEVTTDPDLLSEACAMYTVERSDDEDDWYPAALEILVIAGADEQDARRRQEQRGRGWVTPQADPDRHR